MKSRNFLVTLLSITAMLFLSLLTTSTAQAQTCTPTTTVTEGDLAPGGLAFFGVTSGPGSVTVDHVDAGGTGLRSLTVVGTPVNAIVSIPAFVPGTFAPVTVTFAPVNPALPVDFTLRAANLTQAVFIRVQCVAVPVITFTDLATTKSCTINGNTITCTITVTNNGPDAATNVVITDFLPTETLFVSSAGSAGVTLSNPPAGQSGTVTGTLATLASGASATITVVSDVSLATPEGTVVTNTARARSETTDPNPTNNTASVNILVGVAPVAPGINPIFSGRAIGTFATGITFTDARLADTGFLPQTGGRLTATVASANVSLGAIGRLMTELINTRTSGGADGRVDGGNVFSSQSQAVVNSLNLTVAGVAITATTLTANTMCGTGTPTCTGNSIITGLTIGGVTVPASVIVRAAAQPNTAITVDLGALGTLTVILNEQIIGNSSITVNAVHVIVTALNGTVIANVVVASAESDIAFPKAPTAATATVRGRVLSPSGRGISRARVLLTDSIGQTRTAITNPFGYYSFNGVEVGSTYVFEARDKRYVFTPQALSLTEEITNFNFTAQH